MHLHVCASGAGPVFLRINRSSTQQQDGDASLLCYNLRVVLCCHLQDALDALAAVAAEQLPGSSTQDDLAGHPLDDDELQQGHLVRYEARQQLQHCRKLAELYCAFSAARAHDSSFAGWQRLF
jgi:hypothetical protein